jgi:hypothetical protein
MTTTKTTPVHLLANSVEIYNPTAKTWHVTESLYVGQPGKLNASFSWASEGGAGTHEFWWELHKGNQCVRRDSKQSSWFASSPWMVYLNVDTAALGTGDFRGLLYLDGVLAATIPFTVTPAEKK